ncbi:MAG: zinc-ribbon domain-containing transport protein [Polyangiaceae bacterium]
MLALAKAVATVESWIRRKDRRHLVVGALVVLAVLAMAAMAWAASRPGGGQSYSGSSSRSSGSSSSRSSGGSSSGGGGGGGDLVALLVVLCIEHPVIGIPIAAIVVVVVVVNALRNKDQNANQWEAGAGAASAYTGGVAVANAGARRAHSARTELAELTQFDPSFSLPVFEDFVYFLYAEMHRARGAGAIEMLAPYLTDGVRATLQNNGQVAEVAGIVIGSLAYDDVTMASSAGDHVRVTLVFESNYVERYRPQGERRFFARERVVLSRTAGIPSRSPDKSTMLVCPNCGAPLQAMRGRTCSYCNTAVTPGQKDWSIQSVQLLEREERPPLLTSSVEEVGTNFPTVFDPHKDEAFAHLSQKDPAFAWNVFDARVRTVFEALQVGWTARDPLRVRPYMSDNLFQSQCYWLDLYKQARVINRTDGARVTRIDLARITSDVYFDAITVRVFATGADFTVQESDGKVLSGNPNKPRDYSEYWTFIRGAQKQGAPKGDRVCPNCGAPLQISMTGNCAYCNAKVTTGEFDWVLSRIEQDEAYVG